MQASNGDKFLTILAYCLLVFGLVYFSWHIGKAMGKEEERNSNAICEENKECWQNGVRVYPHSGESGEDCVSVPDYILERKRAKFCEVG